MYTSHREDCALRSCNMFGHICHYASVWHGNFEQNYPMWLSNYSTYYQSYSLIVCPNGPLMWFRTIGNEYQIGVKSYSGIYNLMWVINTQHMQLRLFWTCCICSKYGFGIIISEGIIDYALIVMLLVQCDSRRVVMVSSWGDVWRQRCAPRSGPLIGAEPRRWPAE